jgi:hypothetical protein
MVGGKMRRGILLLLLTCAPLGCDQPINWGAFAGNSADGGAVNPPGVDPPMPSAQCITMMSKAHEIIMANCGQCHVPSAPGTAGGGFNFIDDLTKLVNNTGPGRMQTLLKPKDPPGSLIFSRIVDMSMPPVQIDRRPTQDADVPALRDFIMTCLPAMPPYPQWPQSGPEPVPVTPLVACGPGNTCEDGGCCFFGACRKNGETCGESTEVGAVKGMCMNGTCVNGASECGGLDQMCCLPGAQCSAPGTICGLANNKCIACGEEGQECCKYGPCKSGHNVCAGGGGGGVRPFCAACGLPGQICCGDFPTTARKTCDTGACVHIPGSPGLGDYCPGAPPMAPVRQ